MEGFAALAKQKRKHDADAKSEADRATKRKREFHRQVCNIHAAEISKVLKRIQEIDNTVSALLAPVTNDLDITDAHTILYATKYWGRRRTVEVDWLREIWEITEGYSHDTRFGREVRGTQLFRLANQVNSILTATEILELDPQLASIHGQ